MSAALDVRRREKAESDRWRNVQTLCWDLAAARVEARRAGRFRRLAKLLELCGDAACCVARRRRRNLPDNRKVNWNCASAIFSFSPLGARRWGPFAAA